MPAVTTWLGSTIRPRLPVVAGSGRPRRPLWGSWRMRTALSLTWSVMSSPSWRTNAAASSDSLTSGPRMSKRDPWACRPPPLRNVTSASNSAR